MLAVEVRLTRPQALSPNEHDPATRRFVRNWVAAALERARPVFEEHIATCAAQRRSRTGTPREMPRT